MTPTTDLGNTARLIRWSLGAWMKRQLEQANQGSPYRHTAGVSAWRGGRTASDLAAEIRREISFGVAQVSWLLSSPRDQEILQVAGILLGFPYGPEIQILSDAIIIAGAPKGSQQRQSAEQRVLVTGAGLIADSFWG